MISRATDTILDQAMGELAELHDAGQGWPELKRHLEERWLSDRAPGFAPVPVDEREAAKESLLFRAAEAASHWESLQEDSVFRRRYQVQACIGRGSGGRVFRAIDLRTGGLVALKEVALRDAVPPLTQVQLKVSDFGLNGLHAAAGDARSESTLEWQGDAAEVLRCRLGTPGFMARERARFHPLDDSRLPEAERASLRKESCRGDVFEAGATLRYWLTGKAVWPRTARFDELASLSPDVSGIRNRRLARVVKSALGVERPYESVDALKADLGAWLEAKPTSHDGRLAKNGLLLYRWRALLSTAIAVVGVVASSLFAHSLQETQNGLDLLEQSYSKETISAARRVTDLEHQVVRARAEGNQEKESLLRDFSAELAQRDRRFREEKDAASLAAQNEKAALIRRLKAEKEDSLAAAAAEKQAALEEAKKEKEAALTAAKKRENALLAAAKKDEPGTPKTEVAPHDGGI